MNSHRRISIAFAVLVVLGIGVLVWAANRPSWTPTHITAVLGSADSPDLSVTVEHSRCRRGPRVGVVSESTAAVRIRAEQDTGGDCDDIALTSELTVRLEAALGARRIDIEAPSGERPDLACRVDDKRADRCHTVAG